MAVQDPNMECDYKGTEVMIGRHIKAKHVQDKSPENKKDKKEDTEKRKGKIIDAKTFQVYGKRDEGGVQKKRGRI